MLTCYTILVPIDLSDQSKIALKQAERIAVLTKGELVLLSCIENFRKKIKFFDEDDEGYVNDKLELQFRLDLLVSEVASRTGLKVNGMVTKWKTDKTIAEVADLVGAKLIVMGTNGGPLGFSKKNGSKAIGVVSKSPCPVITIKGEEHFNGCRTI